jgi:hypothetical protein
MRYWLSYLVVMILISGLIAIVPYRHIEQTPNVKITPKCYNPLM